MPSPKTEYEPGSESMRENLPTSLAVTVFRNKAYLTELAETLVEVGENFGGTIDAVADEMYRVYREGGTVYFFGNGGSAAVALHQAGDMTKNAQVDGMPPFHARSLVENITALSAVANDDGWDQIFICQLKTVSLTPRDMVVAYSSSGTTHNVLKAVEFSKKRGAKSVGISTGGLLADIVDFHIPVPTQHLEELNQRSVVAGAEDVMMAVGHRLTEAMYERIQLASSQMTPSI